MRLGRTTRAETCATGDIVLAIRPGRPCRAHLVDAEVSLAALTPDPLADVVGDEEDGREPVRFLSGRPRSAAAAAQWTTAVDYVTATLEARTGVANCELVVGGAVRLLATTMLHVFPNTYADVEDDPFESMDTSPPMLRRAIEFMHANCTRDIGMGEVAKTLNVTPRAVQYMFRRHLDMSPMTYLRQIRLRRAHRDLLAGNPTRDTVAEDRDSLGVRPHRTVQPGLPHRVRPVTERHAAGLRLSAVVVSASGRHLHQGLVAPRRLRAGVTDPVHLHDRGHAREHHEDGHHRGQHR